ncbi:AraC family transcriptional regulator [bacterium SCSIO 12643]|nr:AraC family transcriptional regulator [bacterium SCSIO 12643]
MSITKHIRELFQPIQPTVMPTGGSVSYCEFLPSIKLQPYIYCYWQLKTNKKLVTPFSYKVVSDGCIDILFEINKPQDNFVAGFCRKYTEYELNPEFNYVGIRFLPTIFPQIFKVNAKDLSNKFQNLEGFAPKTSQFIAKHFHQEMTSNEIKASFDHYFESVLKKITFDYDSRLYTAIDIILNNYGVLNLEKDLDVGLSIRQLRRLFHFYIGDSPKTFSKVVQFQNILKAKPSNQSLNQNKLFYDTGHYDQSHFIKDFKTFYGVTPSKAFSNTY